MKALTYSQAHDLENFNLKLTEVSIDKASGHDIKVQIKAISVNPVDYKIRSSRSGENIILGWDASGVITEVGEKVKNFQIGDEVYYAGDLTRNGSYAEFQLVDSRIVGKKPTSLSFSEAAAIPLTALTAWEAMIEKKLDLTDKSTVLVIGGAGGVGSMAIQLLKKVVGAKVIATASREETIKWCMELGANKVINHRKNLKSQINEEVDVIFSTNSTDRYLSEIPELLRPFGHLVLIDDPSSLDIINFKRKSLAIHWELMFSKTLYNYNLESQGIILNKVANLIDKGELKTTLAKVLKGFTSDNVKIAHESAEKGLSIGKNVIEF